MPERLPDPAGTHVEDAETLDLMVLYRKYPGTHSCWKSMIDRRRNGKATVAPEFESFRDYLRILGPQPDPSQTVDRIDNANPHYGPGLVRWASKEGQANNRRTTIWLTCDGETLPLSEWARRSGQKADTLRSRRREGLQDCEVIHGRGHVGTAPSDLNPFHFNPWPELFPESPPEQDYWEAVYRERKDRTRSRLEVIRAELARQFAEHTSELAGHDAYGLPVDDDYRRQHQEHVDRISLLGHAIDRHLTRLRPQLTRIRKSRHPDVYLSNDPDYSISDH